MAQVSSDVPSYLANTGTITTRPASRLQRSLTTRPEYDEALVPPFSRSRACCCQDRELILHPRQSRAKRRSSTGAPDVATASAVYEPVLDAGRLIDDERPK